MKKKETKETKPVEVPVSAEVKLPETPTVVRLEAVEVKPENTVLAGPQEAVKPSELGTSIDNLAKIVESSSVVSQTSTEPVIAVKKTGKSYLWLVASFLLGLGMGIGVGYIIWGRNPKTMIVNNQELNVSPTPVPTISPAVIPGGVTPSPANLQKAALKIEVMNGTGGKGVAAKAKDLLMAAGYTNITTGNADTENYTQTEISLKASKNDYLDGLKKDLAGKYMISSNVKTLEESSVYDVVVTIGSK